MSTPVHPILAFGALHIHWRLLHACLRECEYCPASTNDANCVYMKERLLKMASRVLEKPRPFYAFTFTGGEPALHPFLPDLARFILSSGRNAGITIETTGAPEIRFFDNLLAGLPKGTVRVSLATHPAWHEPELIEAIHEVTERRGQLFHLRLMLDPRDPSAKSSAEFLAAFVSANPAVSHDVCRLPDFQEIPFSGLPYSTAPITSQAMETSFMVERKISQMPASANRWRVQGANLLLISPDGYCHSSLNQVSATAHPLWHEAAKLPDAKIVDLSLQQSAGGIENLMPGFERLEDAELFIAQYADQQKVWAFDAPVPRRKFAASEMQVSDIIRARLKRHLAEADARPLVAEKHANIAPLSLERIGEIFSRLQDRQSQDTLLQAVAAMQTGTELREGGRIPTQETGLASLQIDGMASLEELTQLARTIRWQWPRIDLTLPLNGYEFLDSMQWLMQQLPEHLFRLYSDDGAAHLQAWLPEMPWPGPLASQPDKPEPLVSVIIACRNVQDRIGRSLDSVLIQNIANIEIIIVDDASSDATWDVIELRRRDARALFRAARLRNQIGLAKATDLAFEQATGRYLLFLQPGDILSSGFLDYLTREERGCANVLANITALLEPDAEKLIQLEDSGDSLGSFLYAWSRGYSISACMIEKDYARKMHLRPMAALGDMDIHLGVQIFAANPTIARIDSASVAVQSQAKLPGSESAISHFTRSVEYLRLIADDFGVSPSLLEECIQHLYSRYFTQALNQINEDESLLSELAPLAAYPGLVRNIMAKTAAQFCEHRHLKPVVPPEERDWPERAANPVPEFNMEAYGFADDPDPVAPKLTIIFYNCNGAKTLEHSMDSILNQSFRDYEIIVMDDGSEDGSWTILQDYADFNPTIRLYRSDNPAGRGWHSNFAHERARGDWLAFMDSRDVLEPDILQAAVEACETAVPDMCIYTLQHMLPNGDASWRQFILDGEKSREEAWHLYETGELCADSPCVIYRHGFTARNECSFGEFVNRGEDYFFAKALCSAKTIITWDRIGAKKIVEQDYNLPSAEISYKTITSALRLQAYLAKLIGRTPRGQISPASVPFKNMLLPAIQTLFAETGTFPLASADYEMVAGNPVTMLELIRDYASQNAWEVSRPSQSTAPKPAKLADPLVCIAWKGEEQDISRNLANFIAQDLRQWLMLVPADSMTASPDHIADPRIVSSAEAANIPSSIKYVSFADYGSYLEPGDLLRAASILERDEDIDIVCFMEYSPFRSDVEPGHYTGMELLSFHLDEQSAPLHWQACVFRRSFLEKNGLIFPNSSAGGEILLLNALLKAQKVRLALPEESHARRLRLKPGPAAAQRLREMAYDMSAFFAGSPLASSDGCKNLILKFMDECNLKPVLEHEIDQLTARNS